MIPALPKSFISTLSELRDSADLPISFELESVYKGAQDVRISAGDLKSLHAQYIVIAHSLFRFRHHAGYTHFFCVPFSVFDPHTDASKLAQSTTGAELMQDVDSLWSEIHSLGVDGLDASCRMPAQKLHATLFLLKLLSGAEVERAVAAVKQASPIVYDSVGSTSVLVNVGGLATFGGADKCRVVYVDLAEVRIHMHIYTFP